ncbi:MAG: ABC-F family ATP-binding cassette domain-containing protein [Chloroflexi bacterium]|nr:ABC-F family ATP-binding cassette domain-containing protein [Chloroflexota bacterium]
MLSVFNISKAYGSQVLFTNLTFTVSTRDRIAIIGPNGSGKTTIFEIIAGEVTPDSGTVTMRKSVTIGYTRQEIDPFSHDRLLEHVIHACSNLAGLNHRIQILQEALSEEGDDDNTERLLHELGELQHRFEAMGGYNVEHEAKTILSGMGFKSQDFSRPLNEFSGGWLMRVALAKLLIVNPDLLLLDEPTNHLDLESCIWFENYLKSYQGAVLVTSHDRAFLNRVARKIVSIEQDDVLFYNGRYDEFIVARQKDQESREALATRQGRQLKKEMRFIETFRYKATKASQVQSRIKQLMKVEKVTVPRSTPKIHFSFPEPARSGEEAVSLKHVIKSYDSNIVCRDLNLTLMRGDRVALVGPNGAGKTTLLKILAGVLSFGGGERKLGHNVTTAYYAQYQLELLENGNSVLDELRRVAPAEPEQQLRGLLGAFLFQGDDVFKRVEVLSGGEKSRLSIAKMLIRPANFLLMDEPTNNLDINSREILTDALDAYHGTLCFITHDRTLIREIANKIVEIQNGIPVVYAGNYDDYLILKEKTSFEDVPHSLSESMVQTVGTSTRGFQRQRKATEGDLRNRYYRKSSPVKKRIGEIELKLAALEAEFKDLENYFSTPERYGDWAEITAKNRRHSELKSAINLLTQEWVQLSMESEGLKLEYEETRNCPKGD